MILIVLILFGLALGSFANAAVWRIHQQAKYPKQASKFAITTGRSMCVHCKHPLAPRDLIPVISWLSLRGKCRYCGKSIPDTPITEVLTPVLFIISYLYWPVPWNWWSLVQFVTWLLLVTGFVILSVYDLRWRLLPNKVLVVLSGIFGVQIIVGIIGSQIGIKEFGALGLSILVGGGIFYLLFQLSDGKWIGGGDVKLGALLGAIVGTPLMAALVLFIASLLGTVWSIPLLLQKRIQTKSHLPFGPFLMAAAFVVVLFGESLWHWYRAKVGI